MRKCIICGEPFYGHVDDEMCYPCEVSRREDELYGHEIDEHLDFYEREQDYLDFLWEQDQTKYDDYEPEEE